MLSREIGIADMLPLQPPRPSIGGRLFERHGLARHGAWVVLHRLAQFGLLAHATLSRPSIHDAFFYRFTGLPPDGETT